MLNFGDHVDFVEMDDPIIVGRSNWGKQRRMLAMVAGRFIERVALDPRSLEDDQCQAMYFYCSTSEVAGLVNHNYGCGLVFDDGVALDFPREITN